MDNLFPIMHTDRTDERGKTQMNLTNLTCSVTSTPNNFPEGDPRPIKG